MAAEMIKISGLSEKQPLLQEYCKIKGLQDGDFYKAIDFLFWVNALSITEQTEIIRKYNPDFKIKGCNL